MASTEKHNAVIRKLNLVRGAKRANPRNRDPVSDDDVEDDLPSLVDFLNSHVVAPSITLATPTTAVTPSITLSVPTPANTRASTQVLAGPSFAPPSSTPSHPLACPADSISAQGSGLPHGHTDPPGDNPLEAIDLQALIASAMDPLH
ncbi:hypothetical protein JB92DRAFT_3107518 [Gautieria morchelliformis]|nr:hypothetical protein JB92DRAFT_3107518 [Gautieria morchelliformis]